MLNPILSETRESGSVEVELIHLPQVISYEEAKRLHGVVEAAANANRAIVFDFTNVSSMNSAGLGELVRAFTLCQRNDRRICLAAPGQNLLKVLQITKLAFVLCIASTVELAVTAVGGEV